MNNKNNLKEIIKCFRVVDINYYLNLQINK